MSIIDASHIGTEKQRAGVPYDQQFVYPVDIGHGYRCERCGLKVYNGRCEDCATENGEWDPFTARNSSFSYEGFTGMVQALK